MIRYQKLGYVELNVTDTGRSRSFYEQLVGLEFVGEGERGEVLLRCDADHHSLVLHQAAEPGLKRVGWMLEDEAQFAPLHDALSRHDVAWRELPHAECRARHLGRATRMVEPKSGVTFEFYRPAETRPYAFRPSVARIQRLGHAVIRTAHYSEVTAFLREVLNFAESDSLGEAISFFRCFPNPFHHGFGVGNGTRNGWHHVNFMVTEIDDIGRALHRLNAAGVPIVYGPGRHPASGSVFLYWLDPDGMTVEYSFGMEQFPEHTARAPRRLPASPDFFDSWGGRADPRMASRGELERAEI
ncbi:MAG TPA: VOC family protein [Stellaceae bacterium]|nr:VOC family protein [Stellaceae bacterium]